MKVYRLSFHSCPALFCANVLCDNQRSVLVIICSYKWEERLDMFSWCGLEWSFKLSCVCILYSENHRPHSRVGVSGDFVLFGIAWWALTVCCAHKRRCSWVYFCESLVPVVQDLIMVLTLEETCIIAQGLMRRTSLKLGTVDETVTPFTPHRAASGWMWGLHQLNCIL